MNDTQIKLRKELQYVCHVAQLLDNYWWWKWWCEWTLFLKVLLLWEARGEAEERNCCWRTALSQAQPSETGSPAQHRQNQLKQHLNGTGTFWSQRLEKTTWRSQKQETRTRDISPQQSETASPCVLLHAVETEEEGYRQHQGWIKSVPNQKAFYEANVNFADSVT